MEHTMASKLITYEANSDSLASHGSATAARKLVAFARALSAWVGGVAARCARAIAMEVRIRRDARALMLMSDRMLKDIGLTRAEIGARVRYGRD
jgi:uncharacterized protein YjiS (DUF1127 family)